MVSGEMRSLDNIIYILKNKMHTTRRRLKAIHKEFSFLIREDKPEVGAYMYITKNGKGFRDELQNNIDICKEQAYEDYGVPLNAWQELSPIEVGA